MPAAPDIDVLGATQYASRERWNKVKEINARKEKGQSMD
jgi:hypothetical protein